MTRATRSVKYTGAQHEVLYVAFELGADKWKLGFTTDLATKPRFRVMPARDVERLAREIAGAKAWFRLRPGAAVRSCYEAGRDGFWLHRCLTAAGIDSRVVDSASIEVNRRLRRAKSDRLDARKLLGMLVRYHAGEHKVWSVVRVPTAEEEDRLAKTRDLGGSLEALRMWDDSPLPAGLRARLHREWEHRQFLHGKILELERERQRAIAHGLGRVEDKVRQLLRLRAIRPSAAGCM